VWLPANDPVAAQDRYGSVPAPPMDLHRRSTVVGFVPGCRDPHQRGQSLAEFALILTPLMMVLLGIIQMGLVLSAYVTMSNAAREGARAATVYLYDRTESKLVNDTQRHDAAWSAATNGMGVLSKTAPQFSSSDFVVTYPCDGGTPPSGCGAANDPRSGQYVRVHMTYHLDLLLPIIGQLLPRDANGRMPLTADTTMVVN
jgi:TadE-like protein